MIRDGRKLTVCATSDDKTNRDREPDKREQENCADD